MTTVLCVHNNGTVSVLRDLTLEEAQRTVERLKPNDQAWHTEMHTFYRNLQSRAVTDINLRGMWHHVEDKEKRLSVYIDENGFPSQSCYTPKNLTEFTRVEII